MLPLDTLSNEALESMSAGIGIFSRVSSVPGSPLVSVFQPLLSNRVFSAAGILVGAEILLLLTKYLFRLDTVPLYDVPRDRVLQIPIGELQELLQGLGVKQKGTSSAYPANMQDIVGGTSSTVFPAETPFIVAIYIAADYTSQPFSPSVWLIIPIFTFPGLRGSLPILILTLLETIFVRSVVPPETTGSKHPPKLNQPTQSIKLHPEELLSILKRFGKYFN